MNFATNSLGDFKPAGVAPDLDEKQLTLAFDIWRFSRFGGHDVDLLLAPLIQAEREARQPLARPWLKTARDVLLLSSDVVATRMGVSKQAYCRLEAAEVEGRLTLRSMRKAARAMGCEVVYYIRPTNRVGYSKAIWDRVLPDAKKILKRRGYGKAFEARLLASIVGDLIEKADYRRGQEWYICRPPPAHSKPSKLK